MSAPAGPAEDDEGRFARALTEALARHGLSQTAAAARLESSVSYVNQLATGRKRPSGEQVDKVAAALRLPPAERARLHYAAARDAGFRVEPPPPLVLDLPEDF